MNGTIHHLTTALLIFPVAWVGYYTTGDSTIAIAMGAGCASGLWATPDRDQCEANCHKLNKVIWYVYGKLFRHRGLSHFPILGTLSRLIYLFWWIPLAWLLLGCPSIPEAIIKAAAFAVFGLSLSDLSHIILDVKL